MVFCGLPHGTAHVEIAKLPERVKVIDMSADFRLRDLSTYAEWYGGEHGAPQLLSDAVYGLTEHYRDEITAAISSPVGTGMKAASIMTRHPCRGCNHMSGVVQRSKYSR